MKVRCFSSFTFSYLNRARVLFSSIKRFHPEWDLVALITDEPPASFDFDPSAEPFDSVLYAKDLNIDRFESWVFGHNIVEACTAVKGPFMYESCQGDWDAVVYLDPDTCLFESLEPIERLLQKWDIVLTPHTTLPETTHEAILDNEVGPLKTGIYNLGFCAIRTSGEGARFARWWAERLLSYCHDDIPRGLFVDQRWCDLVPALFDHVKILRDPGYNVASWNISRRQIAVTPDGAITSNGVPLRFWHFTKLGAIADAMTKRYAGDNFQVYEIWNWYRRQIDRFTTGDIPARYWFYDRYADGSIVEREHRLLYRANANLQGLFPNPFATGAGTYKEWLDREGHAHLSQNHQAG